MKKGVKITLIIIGILVSIIIIDTIQAKIFDNSPLLKIRDNLDGGNIDYIDKGILVNHYRCSNNEKVTTWKKEKFACSKEEISIESVNDKIVNFLENNNYSNFAYSYIDTEKNVIIVGLLENNEKSQDEFINKVFTECCGSSYIRYIKNNSIIEFEESMYIFEAKVIELREDRILVEVLKDNEIFNIGQNVIVRTNENLYIVGSKIKITFNGSVDESNPPQIYADIIEVIE